MSHAPGSSIPPRRSLTPDQLQRLLDQADARDVAAPARNRRREPRIGYRKPDVLLRVTHPGGTSVEQRVATRNLSSRGISIVYGGFLHIGTECRILLPRFLDGTETITGSVVWCCHLAGPYHSVGVRFAKPVAPSLFLDPNGCRRLATERVLNPQALRGRLLIADDQDSERALTLHHLVETRLVVVEVDNAQDAMEATRAGSFDGILCDLNLCRGQGIELVRALRHEHFAGPIILVTAEVAPERLQAAGRAGANGVLHKPCDPQQLLGMLSECLSVADTSHPPIVSSMANEPSLDSLIEPYMQKVRDALRQIQKALEADDVRQVRLICQMLKTSSAGVGFAEVVNAGKAAIRALDSSETLADALGEIRELQTVCRRVVAGHEQASASPGTTST